LDCEVPEFRDSTRRDRTAMAVLKVRFFRDLSSRLCPSATVMHRVWNPRRTQIANIDRKSVPLLSSSNQATIPSDRTPLRPSSTSPRVVIICLIIRAAALPGLFRWGLQSLPSANRPTETFDVFEANARVLLQGNIVPVATTPRVAKGLSIQWREEKTRRIGKEHTAVTLLARSTHVATPKYNTRSRDT